MTRLASLRRQREMTSTAHTFHAVAFVENLVLRELTSSFPEAKRAPRELWYTAPAGGAVSINCLSSFEYINATSSRALGPRAPSCRLRGATSTRNFEAHLWVANW